MSFKKNRSLVVDFEHADTLKVDSLFEHLVNLLADFDTRDAVITVDVVVYGQAVSHFLTDSVYANQIQQLIDSGVSFYVCQNAMVAFDIKKEQVHPGVAITPSGVAAIAQLQFDGSAYFKA